MTPGTTGQNHATTIFDDRNEVQPDSALLVLDDHGGMSRDGDDGYLHGSPELIVEIADDSLERDRGVRFREYERAGVGESIVFDFRADTIDGIRLHEGHFRPLAGDSNLILRSEVYPGLWLDQTALVSGNAPAMTATLYRDLDSPEHEAFVAELARRNAEHNARTARKFLFTR